MKKKIVYVLSLYLVAGGLVGFSNTVTASSNMDDNSQSFKEKVNEIFYAKESKIESIYDNDGKEKTLITLEKSSPSLKNNLFNNEKEMIKETSACVFSISVNEVIEKRNSRASGSLEDSSGTANGVVEARVAYYFAPIGSSSQVDYYGISWAEGRYYPSQAATTTNRRIHYGQNGQNPLMGTVKYSIDRYPGDINYQWISYNPTWIFDGDRISSIFGGLGVTTYATYTVKGVSDDVNVTVSPFV